MFKNVSPQCVLYVLNNLLHCDDVKHDSEKKCVSCYSSIAVSGKSTSHHQRVYIHVQMEEGQGAHKREKLQMMQDRAVAFRVCVCVLNTTEKPYRTHYTHTHTHAALKAETHTQTETSSVHTCQPSSLD